MLLLHAVHCIIFCVGLYALVLQTIAWSEADSNGAGQSLERSISSLESVQADLQYWDRSGLTPRLLSNSEVTWKRGGYWRREAMPSKESPDVRIVVCTPLDSWLVKQGSGTEHWLQEPFPECFVGSPVPKIEFGYFYFGSVMSFPSFSATREATEKFDNTTCARFKLFHQELCIGEDGVVRWEVRDGDRSHVAEWHDVRINQGLSDDFTYRPPASTLIREFTWKAIPGGSSSTAASREVRAPVDPITAAKSREVALQLIEVRSSLQSVGLQFDEVRYENTQDPKDGSIRRGKVVWARPNKFSISYQSGRFSGPLASASFEDDKNYFISDGVTAWSSGIPSTHSFGDSDILTAPLEFSSWETALEIRSPNAGNLSATPITIIGATAAPILNVLARTAPRPETLNPMDLGLLDSVDPFLGVNVQRLVYERDEKLDGVPCRVFWIAPREDADYPVPMRHWIGVSDGVPRRIDEFQSYTQRISRSLIVSDVKTAPIITGDTFSAPKSSKQPRSVKEYYEKIDAFAQSQQTIAENNILRQFFALERQDVKNVKYFVWGLLGGAAFMRFETDKEVTLTKENNFTEEKMTSPDFSKRLDIIKQVFPSDAALLDYANELKAVVHTDDDEQEGNHSRTTVISNTSKHTYFFVTEWAG